MCLTEFFFGFSVLASYHGVITHVRKMCARDSDLHVSIGFIFSLPKSFCQADHFFIFPHTSENMKKTVALGRTLAASMIRSDTRDELSYLLPGAPFFVILRLSCTRSHKKLGVDHLFLGWLALSRLCSFFVAIFFISFFLGWKWFNLSIREMVAWALPLRTLHVQIDEKMWEIFLGAVAFLFFCSSRFWFFKFRTCCCYMEWSRFFLGSQGLSNCPSSYVIKTKTEREDLTSKLEEAVRAGPLSGRESESRERVRNRCIFNILTTRKPRRGYRHISWCCG
jgi:hypothetical protein